MARAAPPLMSVSVAKAAPCGAAFTAKRRTSRGSSVKSARTGAGITECTILAKSYLRESCCLSHFNDLRHQGVPGTEAGFFDLSDIVYQPPLIPRKTDEVATKSSRSMGRDRPPTTTSSILFAPEEATYTPIRGDFIDTLEVRVRQHKFSSRNVLRHTSRVARTWDRDDVVLPRQKPS